MPKSTDTREPIRALLKDYRTKWGYSAVLSPDFLSNVRSALQDIATAAYDHGYTGKVDLSPEGWNAGNILNTYKQDWDRTAILSDAFRTELIVALGHMASVAYDCGVKAKESRS